MSSPAVLLLIHGGGSGADAWGNWRDCIPRYAERFRVIAVDIPGFGRSGRPDPETFSYGQTNRNRHMIAFIEAVAGGPIHIIGNFHGGRHGPGRGDPSAGPGAQAGAVERPHVNDRRRLAQGRGEGTTRCALTAAT
jgi:pimeloyl-ACP methyl ester carboxylesterase